MKRRTLIAGLAAAGLATQALSQAATDRPIRIVIGYPPGGATDNMARMLARNMAERLKQPVIVDPRPGASTVIASQHVFREKPDGNTLFLADVSSVAINQHLYPQLGFDPTQGFTPIARIAILRIGLLVPANSRFATMRDFLDAAKRGSVTVASSGAGNITHIAQELFKRHAGIDVVHVPYKGGAPALQDLMGGQVDAYFGDVPASVAYVKSGRLRYLGIMAERRNPEMPDAPTFAEAGIPNFIVHSWFGVLAPRGLAPELVDQYGRTIRASLETPELSGWMRSQTLEPAFAPAGELAQNIRTDADKYGKLIREIGLKLD